MTFFLHQHLQYSEQAFHHSLVALIIMPVAPKHIRLMNDDVIALASGVADTDFNAAINQIFKNIEGKKFQSISHGNIDVRPRLLRRHLFEDRKHKFFFYRGRTRPAQGGGGARGCSHC